MIKFNRIPDYLKQRYESWKSDSTFGRSHWVAETIESEELYYNDVEHTGTTFTESEYSNIMKKLGIPVSLNWIHPICNQKLAILSQVKPSIKVMSLDGRAKQHAMVLDKIKHGILYTSNASSQIEEAIKEMLISGMGCLMVNETTWGQYNLFGLSINHVPFDEVILDINAKKKSLEDMEGFFIEKVFTAARAMQIYGGLIDQLRDENGQPVSIDMLASSIWVNNDLTAKQDITTTQWNTSNKIIAREFYEKIYTTMYVVADPLTGLNKYLFSENLTIPEQTLLNDTVTKQPGIYIKRTILLGEFTIWEEVLPITEYPLKVMFFEWGGKPYRSYGMPHFTKDAQIASDKFLHIMLLNGIVSNNAGWTSPVGAIPEDKREAWARFLSDPTGIKEYVPIDKNGTFFKPERDQVQQLSNFYPEMVAMMKNYIEFSTGVSAVVQGDARESKVDVFSSLQQYQNAAMMRMILSTTHINETMQQLGQVLVEYITASITPETYLFFDEKGNLNELKIAQELANDIRTFRFLTVSIPSTAMPTQRLSAGTELFKIAQTTTDPVERSAYTQTALELSEIKEMDELKERLDIVQRVQSQLNNLQLAYDRLDETSKQIENKFINSELENRILKKLSTAETKIASSFSELETKISLAEEMRKLNETTKTSKES